jgi:hypothetical protein
MQSGLPTAEKEKCGVKSYLAVIALYRIRPPTCPRLPPPQAQMLCDKGKNSISPFWE